jgi:stearoyl-CoA desaturase (delta-9 desaturase)
MVLSLIRGMKIFEWTFKKAAVFQALATASVPFALMYLDNIWMLLSLAVFWAFSLATTAGLHRLFVHNTYQTSRFWHWVLGLTSCLSMTSSPLQWAVAHYTHHKYSDTDKDPHNRSLAKIFGIAYFSDANYDFSRAKRLLKDKMHSWLFKYYFLVPLIWTLLWYIIGGLSAAYFSWIFPAVVYMWASALHTRYSHQNGKAVNMHPLFVLLFLGEHLHKDHHDKPNEQNYAKGKFQIDPGYCLIRLIKNDKN